MQKQNIEEQFAWDCYVFRSFLDGFLKDFEHCPRVIISVFIRKIIEMAKQQPNSEIAFEQVIKTLKDDWEKDKAERKCN